MSEAAAGSHSVASAPAPGDPASASTAGEPRPRLWPVAAWLGALTAAWLWGRWLESRGYDLVMFGSQPFLGGPRFLVTPGILVALTVAAAAVFYLPLAARRLSWWPMLLVGWGTAAVWAWSLTLVRSTEEFTRPLRRDDDYLNDVDQALPDPLGFLSGFTDNILQYAVHTQGHPPGQVMFLTGLASLGVTSPTWIALLYLLVGTSALVAVAVTVRALGHEGIVIRALPVLVLVPAAVWIATSPDAFFGGVLAWGVALLALATTTDRHLWIAVPAGLVLGTAPFLSYGLLPMGIVLIPVVWLTRSWRAAAVAAATGLAVVAAWAAAGFWIVDGISATRIAWELNGASVRPYWYFAVANLVVLATLVGPAVLAGLPGIAGLPRAVRWLIIAAIAGALFGSLSGFMRGEVERIWLPLVFWIALAGAVTGPRRGWLVAQVAVALIAQIVIRSPW